MAICLQKIFFLNSVWCYILKREIKNSHFFHVAKVIKLVSGIQTWHIYTSFQNLEKCLCSCRLLWFWCICATRSIHREKIICVFPVVLYFLQTSDIYIYIYIQWVNLIWASGPQFGPVKSPNLGQQSPLIWAIYINFSKYSKLITRWLIFLDYTKTWIIKRETFPLKYIPRAPGWV